MSRKEEKMPVHKAMSSKKQEKMPVHKEMSSKKAKEQRESASESLKVVDPQGALV